MRSTVWFVQEKHSAAEGSVALLTLMVSFYLFFLTNGSWLSVISPIWPLLTLCYWRKRWPAFANMWLFWLVGLLLDLCSSSMIGSYALIYLIVYCIISAVFSKRGGK